jgi:hypothetical protein
MAVVEVNAGSAAEIRTHRRTFYAFERLVLFAVMHVALTLGCLALAFLGHAELVGLLLWIGGTLAIITGFAVTGTRSYL